MKAAAEKLNPLFRQELFFWCCAVVSLLALLGSHALFWEEPRIAEAAREILVTKRWYPFTVNFEPCGDLPPLEVWSIALIFKIHISEFSARLPSVAAAFALLIGISRLANMLFDRRTALLATWLTLGSFGVLYMGRCCVPGMIPAAIAVWSLTLYLRGVEKRDFRSVPAAFALLTLGVLDRGSGFVPIALLLPWMYAHRRSFDWRVAAATAVAVVVPCLAWGLLPGDRSWLSPKALWNSVDVAAALKRWGSVWMRGGSFNPAVAGLRDSALVVLPWILVTVTALGGALCRVRELSGREQCLLTGIGLGFLALVIPGRAQRPDFLPLVPLLALETGVCVLRGDGGRLTRWTVVATRSVIIVLASFGVVSPVTIPLWRRVLNLELPMLFWVACFLFGAAVLLIMMLDSYPTRPLPRLTGLSDPLGSTILGGTLTSICLLSFLLPSMREVRVEKSFLLAVGSDVSEFKPAAVVNIGRRDSTEMLLFYARIPERIATISVRDGKAAREAFVRELLRHPGGRVAVVARHRRREFDFLRGAAAEAKLTIDVGNPHRKEEIPYIYSELRADDEYESPAPGIRFLRHACWLVNVPEKPKADKIVSTSVQDKGK